MTAARQVLVRLTDAQHDRLDALALTWGCTAQAALRRLLDEEHPHVEVNGVRYVPASDVRPPVQTIGAKRSGKIAALCVKTLWLYGMDRGVRGALLDILGITSPYAHDRVCAGDDAGVVLRDLELEVSLDDG